MAHTKLPLAQWFLAMYLLAQSKNGISAMELRRHLGVRYPTAWLLKQKLMQTMREGDDDTPLSGAVQVDDAFWGGERHGGKRGRENSVCCSCGLCHRRAATAYAYDTGQRIQ